MPPHVHTREDEFSIVTAGSIGFRSGPDEVVLGPGGYIVKPRGELHTMWNAGTTEARMIEVITPAGFEQCFAEVADMIEAGPPSPSDLEALAKRYGVFFDATWVPELMRSGTSTHPSADLGLLQPRQYTSAAAHSDLCRHT